MNILDAVRGLGGLVYFFECGPKSVNIMPCERAIGMHPKLVLDFLEGCLE